VTSKPLLHTSSVRDAESARRSDRAAYGWLMILTRVAGHCSPMA
jgi:hypothetical protein